MFELASVATADWLQAIYTEIVVAKICLFIRKMSRNEDIIAIMNLSDRYDSRPKQFAFGVRMLSYCAGAVVALSTSGCMQTAVGANSPDSQITVSAGRITNNISPLMYGSCIEDVNHEIYGGLYDQRLFGESFEEPAASDNIAGWTAYGGFWHVSNSVCHVAADAGGKMVRQTPDIGDATVSADILFPNNQGDNAGLLVRVQNPGVGADTFDGYEISISPSRQRLILGKHMHDWHPIQEVPIPVQASQWIHLRVQLAGARIRVFVAGDNTPAIDYTDQDHALLSGQFAIRTWNSDAAFGNIAIQTATAEYGDQFSKARSTSISNQWDQLSTGTASASYKIDPYMPYNGKYSQVIQHGLGTGNVGIANRGLARWGIPVSSGRAMQGRIYLRSTNLQGPVTVALQSADGSRTYAAQSFQHIKADWAKYTFTLTPSTTDPNARFAVWINRPGTLCVDQAVLMDTGNALFHGLPIRADIGNAMVAEGVTFLRYGGTMVNAPEYRWKHMIGDPDKRPQYNGHWYPYSTNGFGIFDFLNFCEAAHIQSAFAINCEETDQDAADLADYLTGSTATVWGRKRAKDGHPAPYNVQYIEIGNEEVIWGDNPTDYAHYAARFQAIAKAIHSRNPDLKLVCAAWWAPQSASMKTVFNAVNGEAAAWDLHVNSDDARAGEGIDQQITQMQTMFKQWDQHSVLKAVIFEENGNLHNMQRALGHASTLNATLRHGDFILADCPANCLQPDGHNDNGWDQGQIFFTPAQVWEQPPYYVQQMAASERLPLRVDSTVSSPGDDLQATSTMSLDGKTLVLNVVNRGNQAHTTSISLQGYTPQPQASVQSVAGQLNDINTSDAPQHISVERSAITAAGQFSQTYAPLSDTVIRFVKKD